MSTNLDPNSAALAGQLIELHPHVAAGSPSVGVTVSPGVLPPTDAELVWYLGTQRRWVQLVTLASFLLAAVSLVRFVSTSVWLYPLLLVLAINISGVVLSLISGMPSTSR